MRAQRHGKIVAIGTDAGRVATVGESFIGGATGGMMQMCRVLARELGRDEELTERELEVVTLLAQGMSNAEIAAAMFVSEATVKSHLGRITAKWGVRDRIQVLIRATQLGLVTLV